MLLLRGNAFLGDYGGFSLESHHFFLQHKYVETCMCWLQGRTLQEPRTDDDADDSAHNVQH